MNKPTKAQAQYFAFNPFWKDKLIYEEEQDKILEKVGISREKFEAGKITRKQASELIALSEKYIENI